MSETAWHRRRPGEFTTGPAAAEARTDDGEAVVLFGDLSVPDRVRLPPELGGGVERVIGHRWGTCPKHEPELWGAEGTVPILTLANGFLVAECRTCAGFSIFTVSERKEA